MANIVPPFVPSMEAIRDPIFEDQLLEWIGLLILGSPRICQADDIDSYLCRYSLPEAFVSYEETKREPHTVVNLRWHGFSSPRFVQYLWSIMKPAIADHEDQWFALSAATFENSSYTVLCPGGGEILLWECD